MLDKVWIPRTPQQWFWIVIASIMVPPIIVTRLFGGIDLIWWLILSGVPILVLVVLKRNRTHGLPGMGVVRADFTVPHAAFTPTAEGFIVEFSKMPLWLRRIMGRNIIFWFITSAYWVVKTALGIGTRVEVTKDKIKINSKTFERSSFTGFSIGKGLTTSSGEKLVVLNYGYGSRRFPFGGAWESDKANEVASALNNYLNATPSLEDEGQLRPEQLRTARPSEF
jgi:hypothetical protein